MRPPRYVWILVAIVLGLIAVILFFSLVDINGDPHVGMWPERPLAA